MALHLQKTSIVFLNPKNNEKINNIKKGLNTIMIIL